jgi:C4-dicarboxylate-specific signal transduction histidine kinase
MGEYLNLIRKLIRPNFVITEFSPIKEIEEAVDILGYKMRSQSVSCTISNYYSRTLTGNPLLFHQIALNLISNAVDSYININAESSRVININLQQKESSLLLTVEDFGCGISEENESRIFENFFTTKEVQGLGIGLAHIKKIIENDFHGSISFLSTQNKGTIFSVIIPLLHNESSSYPTS